jgi:hypothetical protein
MIADMWVELQLHVSDTESDSTTWSITDTDGNVSQLEAEVCSITLNEEMRFIKELSISLIECEAW